MIFHYEFTTGEPLTRELLERSRARLARGRNVVPVIYFHTDLELDIREMRGFRSVAEYAMLVPLCDWEIGSITDDRLSDPLFRFIVTADLLVDRFAKPLYPSLFVMGSSVALLRTGVTELL